MTPKDFDAIDEVRGAITEALVAIEVAIERHRQAAEDVRTAKADAEAMVILLGDLWAAAGVEPDRELLAELYWTAPNIKVEALAQAFRIKNPAGVFNHVPKAGDYEFRCRACGDLLRVGFRSRSEMAAASSKRGGAGLHYCGPCDLRNREEARERWEQHEHAVANLIAQVHREGEVVVMEQGFGDGLVEVVVLRPR